MNTYVKCCDCGKQTLIAGLNFTSSKCQCGCEAINCHMGATPPTWWVPEKKDDNNDK